MFFDQKKENVLKGSAECSLYKHPEWESLERLYIFGDNGCSASFDTFTTEIFVPRQSSMEVVLQDAEEDFGCHASNQLAMSTDFMFIEDLCITNENCVKISINGLNWMACKTMNDQSIVCSGPYQLIKVTS